MRRYDDIKELTYRDGKVLSEGNLEVYVGKSKIDQKVMGLFSI